MGDYFTHAKCIITIISIGELKAEMPVDYIGYDGFCVFVNVVLVVL